MLYSDFADACERISGTPKRLEIRGLVAGLLSALSRDEIGPATYMLQGRLRPEYEDVELGVGEALAARAVSVAAGASERDVKDLSTSTGDLGSAASDLLAKVPREGRDTSPALLDVYSTLLGVTGISGEGSQESKITTLAALLRRVTPLEAKHIVRLLLGKLRLGVKEMTIVDALAEIYKGEDIKAAKERIETAFNVTSDMGEVGNRLLEGGLAALEGVTVTVGKPVRAMLAEREATLKDVLDRMDGSAALEYKYDGLRLQAHVSADGRARLFSRSLEDMSDQFPDVLDTVKGSFRTLPVIVDGECVPFDPTTGELRPFQEISRRRGRKYDLPKMMEDVPVKYLVFDVLLAGKDPFLTRPYAERRQALEGLVKTSDRIALASRAVVNTVEEAEAFFQQALVDGCEGVVAKSLSPQSLYKPGGRGFWWIKYKREYTHELADTIDAVIVGAFHGRGKRAGWFGAFLMAVYDKEKETFPTICKVGTGFDEETLEDLTQKLKGKGLDSKPESVETSLSPDVWVEPTIVLELRGAELTLSPVHYAARDQIRENYGLALRFPRFTGTMRDEKRAEDSNAVEEVVRMYKMQVKKASE